MMRIAILLIVFISACSSFAQGFSNDWLDGKYDQTWLKFEIAQDGIYRIDLADFNAIGVQAAEFNGANLQVFLDGQEIPIYVTTPGRFTSNDYMEFVGKRNVAGIEKNLYQSIDHVPDTSTSLFTDTAVYFLTWNNKTNNLRYTDDANLLSNLPAKEEYFMQDIYARYTTAFSAGEPFDVTGSGTRLTNAQFGKGEGWTSTNVAGNSGSGQLKVLLDINDLAANGPDATMNMTIMGASNDNEVDIDHHVQIEVGNSTFNEKFDGWDIRRIQKTIPWADLDANDDDRIIVTVSTLIDLADIDIVTVPHVHIQYPQSFDFDKKSSMVMPISGSSVSKYLEIENWDDNNSTPLLYDTKNARRMEGIMNNDLLKVLLPAQSNGRNIYLQNDADVYDVIKLKKVTFTDYSLLANQGDFVILTNSSLFNDGFGNNYIDAYRSYRDADFTALVVDVEDIINQFAYGRTQNPLGIRYFLDYAFDQWFIQPEYLFIIGMANNYSTFRTANTGGQYMAESLVPSYGDPASDPLLAATDTSYIPRIPVGRIAVERAEEVSYYLEKIVAHESAVMNSEQSIGGKAWTKNIIHLGGGSDKEEQERFSAYLKGFEEILEGPKFGANVHTFLKTSSDPIQNAVSTVFDDLIIEGTSMINFFGHSSGTKLEFSIYNPENYDNVGKFPFMLSNGCFAGNIHTTKRTASRKFVLIEDKGAIGFLSATTLSFDKYDQVFSDAFLENLSTTMYGRSVGASLVDALHDIRLDSDPYIEFTSTLFTLHGDPSLKINPHEKPDYIVEDESTWFEPANISVNEDTFHINLTITNVGMAVDDTFNVIVNRKYPSGVTASIFNQEYIATRFRDTIAIPIVTDAENGLGYNEFTITVDPSTDIDQIPEMEDVTNNTVIKSILILSDDVLPLYPFDNGIVNTQGVTLIASIANAFSEAKSYLVEIDTNATFANPLTTVKKMNKGGLLKWAPNITLTEGQTYFWRCTLDPAESGGKEAWHSSSFTYNSTWTPGWNQSHLDQFADNDWTNVEQDQFGTVSFVDDVKDINILTFNKDEIPNDSIAHDDRGYSINGTQMHNSKCFSNIGGNVKSGISFAVFDRASLIPQVNKYETTSSTSPYGGEFGSYHCDTKNYYGYDFFDSTYSSNQQYAEIQTEIRRRNIINFIDQVEDGDYILAYIFPKNVRTRTWPDSLYAAFESFGAKQVRNIPDYAPYAVFGQKGNPTFQVFEAVGVNEKDVVNLNIQVSGLWSEGFVESEIIGPAESWENLVWEDHAPDKSAAIDSNFLSVIGITSDGIERTLIAQVTSSNFDLSSINTRDYPYLKLRYFTSDDSLRTPSWIRNWRVNYASYPEMAINANAYCDCAIDTLYEGQDFDLTVALENVTKVNMDSLVMEVRVIGEGNTVHNINIPKMDSLMGQDTMHAKVHFNTLDMTGKNQLSIVANVGMEQPEVTMFNNIGYLPFYVIPDNANPLLDVTFDGEHILDGDIVSGEPEILISLKDENEYLPLNDTALFKIYIEYPDGAIEQIVFGEDIIEFIPPSEGKNNKAQIVLTPKFTKDGIHKLRVAAQDVTGNASGKIDYMISFEVILKSTITRVLNYPNPFTTSTRFVFTLTGSTIPDVFKIQIMTVSGTIVKEIGLDELGPIHVGRNITEYAWNGTDEFGDKLANGIYLYRVVTSIDGEDIELRNTKADQYFKSDFGKMTIIR